MVYHMMRPKMNNYSIIIPTFNEEARISTTIQRVRELNPEIEILIVDGRSTYETVQIARALGVRVIDAPRCRGAQCNAGANQAKGDVLIFLHADTLLPTEAFNVLSNYFANHRLQIGTFRLAFDENDWLLRAYAAFTRFDSIFTSFGDQCIVVRKSFFEEIGGFPNWLLFEDVHLLRMARRRTKIFSFPATVTTSARRFLKVGTIRTQLINGWLILQYLLGDPPNKLAAQYEGSKKKVYKQSFSYFPPLKLKLVQKALSLSGKMHQAIPFLSRNCNGD